jgi:hypothetical protein
MNIMQFQCLGKVSRVLFWHQLSDGSKTHGVIAGFVPAISTQDGTITWNRQLYGIKIHKPKTYSTVAWR